MPIHKMTAADLMSRRVQTVPSGAPLADALAIMEREGFSQLPVMQGRKPVALLTEADVRHALLQNRQGRPVQELASPLPRLMAPGDRVSEVLEALQHSGSLLVVTATGRLQGIITYWDIMTLARPYLMVTEVELLLRRAAEHAYRKAHGPRWWLHVPEELRQRAEEEHQSHADGTEPSPEHMLGHTSFWSLIEIYRHIRPELPEERFKELHRVRELRNQVAHHYRLTNSELLELRERCFTAGDWLERQTG